MHPRRVIHLSLLALPAGFRSDASPRGDRRKRGGSIHGAARPVAQHAGRVLVARSMHPHRGHS